MTDKELNQVEAIFHAANALKPSERAAFLDLKCGDNLRLRAEVESLLAAADDSQDFLEAPATDFALSVIEKISQQEIIGKHVNSYKVLALLGEGGMGQVYLCEDTKLGRKLALKFLPPTFDSDALALKRFQLEAKTTSLLNHPNIITVYEIGESEGRAFIATEYVEGQTLRRLIDSGKLTTNESLRIITAVANALEAAHNAGIIHRDIKPENIMVRDDGLVKLLDFGIAKQPLPPGSERAATNSVPGVILGTISYMSPEQLRGTTVDERSDIWSLGVVLFEMVTGEKMFQGGTPADIIASIIQNPTTKHANKSPLFNTVLRRAVCPDREERYQTIREFLDDLSNVGLNSQSFSTPLDRILEPPRPSLTARHRLFGLQQFTSEQILKKRSTWKVKLAGGVLVTLLTLSSGLAVHYKLTDQPHDLEITQLTPSTKKSYGVGRLKIYSTAFIDRSTHSFTNIPTFLLDQPYILTANDDRCSEREPNFSFTFDVTAPVTVYVGHDDRYEKKPAWLSSFERTDLTLTLFMVGQPEPYGYHLYKRDYLPGTVALGSNIDTSCGEMGSFAMYTVIVVPKK